MNTIKFLLNLLDVVMDVFWLAVVAITFFLTYCAFQAGLVTFF